MNNKIYNKHNIYIFFKLNFKILEGQMVTISFEIPIIQSFYEFNENHIISWGSSNYKKL